ncbi:Flp pilus assembly complex ATPase component TadA [Pseudomonas aeruginosa]|nr:Flp pilus assembly complex ATPase component TadA [Pseudomonas aeruginosa]
MSSEAVSPGPQMTAEWIPLGQRLLERGLVSGQELERALDLQRRLGGRLGGILVRSGAISENTLMQVLAEQLRLPLVGDDLRKPSEESIAAFLLSTPINTDWFVEEQLVVWEEGEQLLFAAREPLSPSIRETLGYFYPERSIQAVLCRSQDLDGWLEHSLDLDRLGMLPDHLRRMRAWVAEPHGIILVTGPTGSGKSTTLYGALEEINDGVRKLISVEDPVEYQVPNITQVQVHADIGLTFAAALRSILRQDPDVIMIGEIRDLETAEIAVQSSLTGHLVLSTLHTNDAVSAFTRLIDMGVEPFLVASPVRGVQAQRLVRRLCAHCAEPCEPTLAAADLAATQAATARLFPGQAAQWRVARGCGRCEGTGYSGRVGIYELVDLSSEMRDLIVQRASLEQMHRLAASQGQRNLREDGLIKAWLGMTSLDEVHRVTSG